MSVSPYQYQIKKWYQQAWTGDVLEQVRLCEMEWNVIFTSSKDQNDLWDQRNYIPWYLIQYLDNVLQRACPSSTTKEVEARPLKKETLYLKYDIYINIYVCICVYMLATC